MSREGCSGMIKYIALLRKAGNMRWIICFWTFSFMVFETQLTIGMETPKPQKVKS